MRRIAALLPATALALLGACDDGDGATNTDRDTNIDADAGVDGASDGSADTDDAGADGSGAVVPSVEGLPLEPHSPWPKFRRDAEGTSSTPLVPTTGGLRWTFATGKGIFSTPVVAADGTVYVGSADRNFYAINPDGTERWRFETGEIIDSAALLDDLGRVYFGSGDGFLYALDAQTGQEVWRFEAEDPATTGGLINWFEGNVAITPDGTLVVPNDNFRIYGIDRQTGEQKWAFAVADQTWSHPAIDLENNRIYIGNNNLIPGAGSVFGITFAGRRVWQADTLGSVAASPLLAGNTVIVGSFDGIIRGLDPETGDERYTVETGDHIYASPALHPDGFVLQPSADGTVYAFSPANGSRVWAFDWGAPIRSSPVVDGNGRIFFGTGDGHLVVLNADGTLRWALRLIDDDRDDLNASPALGTDAVYIAGESGEVFSVPVDYCLEANDALCVLGPDEPLPNDGAFVLFTTRFGTPLVTPPSAIAGNDALAFSLSVRQGGDTELALIDGNALTVTLDPPSTAAFTVSADRRFFTLVPETDFAAGDDGRVRITVAGRYLVDPEREGLRTEGGLDAGGFEQTFEFEVLPDGERVPLLVGGDAASGATTLEMRRLAAPMPTLLPSYNQIGFDSLHFIVGLVELSANGGIAWVVEGRPGADGGPAEPIPDTRGLFAFNVRHDADRLTLENNAGVELVVMNAAIGFDTFRVASRFDEFMRPLTPATVQAAAVCGSIPLYGIFLRRLGLCNPETDLLTAFGAVILEPWDGDPVRPPAGLVQFSADDEGLRAQIANSSLRADACSVALLAVNARTGLAVSLEYGTTTERVVDGDGNVTSVFVPWGDANPGEAVRVYLMCDTWPLDSTTVE